MTPRVELIFDAGCPNVEQTRRHLRQAFTSLGMRVQWVEWERSSPNAPSYVIEHGSPTVLVDGRDVWGESTESAGGSCRLYRDRMGVTHGAPPVEVLARSLRQPAGGSGGHHSLVAAIPAVGVSLMPKLVCPACWPAYSGMLTAVGLGFLVQTKYLLPLTLVFLIIALAALAFRAAVRRGYAPFGVGLVAAIIVMVAKFVFDYNPAMFGGIGLLVAASIWNAWPERNRSVECPACAGAPTTQ